MSVRSSSLLVYVAVGLLTTTCVDAGETSLTTGLAAPIELVFIPGGEFEMGTPLKPPRPWRSEPEEKLHRVTLSSFYMGKYPVTVQQFCEFLNHAGFDSRYADRRILQKFVVTMATNQFLPKDGGDSLPITGITYYGANSYCSWLSARTKRPCRLPTEAEWEYAARGAAGRIYPWGNENKPHPKGLPAVGATPDLATPGGVHDMLGSVYQWCVDEFDLKFYEKSPMLDPVAESGDGRRVLRGGPGVRVGLREKIMLPPAWKRFASRKTDSHIGFRIAVTDAK